MASKDVVSQGGAELVSLDEVERCLLDPTAKLSLLEDTDAASAIVAQILGHDDPFAESQVTAARELLGVALMVDAVDWRNSDIEGEGLGIYALIHATDERGNQLLVTCGGRNVLAQLYRAQKLGALPQALHFEESKPTAKGYRALWLRRSKFEHKGTLPLRDEAGVEF